MYTRVPALRSPRRFGAARHWLLLGLNSSPVLVGVANEYGVGRQPPKPYSRPSGLTVLATRVRALGDETSWTVVRVERLMISDEFRLV